MHGYDAASYGDGMADVYDDWYTGITDVGTTCAALEALAIAGLPVLELGIGTGRLAVPLAARGLDVHGIDASQAMLDRLEINAAGHHVHAPVHATLGDMVDDLPDGPYGLVFVAYNTIFNLLTAERQQACFDAVAVRLAPGAAFVIEAFVPDPSVHGPDPRAGVVTVRSLTADRVVLSVSRADPDRQVAEGQFVELDQAGGVRLRPWAIRWASPDELDTAAATAGLALDQRWESFDGSPFTVDSPRHVSVYRRFHTSVHPIGRGVS